MATKPFAAQENAPLSLRERQRLEREHLILETADEVFIEHGYYDTSMEEIARRVGIAKGTIYLHFPSKDELVLALIIREMTKWQSVIVSLASSGGSARERLASIIHHIYVGRNNARRQVFITFCVNLAAQKKSFEQSPVLQAFVKELAGIIRGLLEQGVSEGEFSRRIPVDVMLAIFLELLSPRAYPHMFQDESLPVEELAAHISRIFFTGITATDGVER